MRFTTAFKTALLLVFVLVSCSERTEYSLKNSLYNVLSELNSSLVSLQNTDQTHPDFGGLWCRHCKLYHTRAAEAVYPLAYLYSNTKEKRYLDASIALGNWLIRQQFPDGSWKETPEVWTGTTTDQLLMMVQAFQFIRNHLNETEQQEWLHSVKMAGDYLVNTMTPEFASINYVATTTASLMVLHLIVPDEKYVQKARHLARQVIAKMDDDLFITGEGGRVFDAKYGVDLGYNMEMSLWGLALYARLSGDTLVLNKVVESAKRHLHFIYPDGSLDGSWGIRSNKWTCFGGATSDGVQVLFSLLGNYDNRFYTASARNLEYLKTCMKDGFVGYGPLHWEVMPGDPCIYPTFAKAKNLAMALTFLEKDPQKYPPLPSDKSGLSLFPTLNLALVRTANFCATVTAYGYKDPKGSESKYMFRPTGGALSNLWMQDYGFLTASSQTEYHRWEPMHFPEADHLKSLTPRIEFENEKGFFTNLYEFDATTSYSQKGNEIEANVFGELKNREQEAGGIGYSYQYTFTDDRIIKKIHVRYHSIRDTIRIVEPVIQYPNTRMNQLDEKTIYIKAGSKEVRLEVLKGKAVLTLGDDAGEYWSPYPALRAIPVILTLIPDNRDIENEVIYRFQIK
jgi:hypothetical protein